MSGVTPRAAFSDARITRTEATQLMLGAQVRAGISAANPEQMEMLLTEHLHASGMSSSNAADAAGRIVDAFVSPLSPSAAVTFSPTQVAFDSCQLPGPLSDTTSQPAGFPDRLTARTPSQRQEVYQGIEQSLSARFGGPTWFALGDNACGQVAQDISSLARARGAIRDMLSGDLSRMADAAGTFVSLLREDSAISRSIGILMETHGLTPGQMAKMAAGSIMGATPVGAVAQAVGLEVEGVTDGIGIAMRNMEQALFRMQNAFLEGNQQIFDNVTEAADQYVQGGLSAVTNPQLREAFRQLEAGDHHGSAMTIARYEQTLIQPLFERVDDLMDAVPEIRWTPPGEQDSEVLGSGEQWGDLNARLAIIRDQVLPRFDIRPGA